MVTIFKTTHFGQRLEFTVSHLGASLRGYKKPEHRLRKGEKRKCDWHLPFYTYPEDLISSAEVAAANPLVMLGRVTFFPMDLVRFENTSTGLVRLVATERNGDVRFSIEMERPKALKLIKAIKSFWNFEDVPVNPNLR